MNSEKGPKLLSSRMAWFAQHNPTKPYATVPKVDNDCIRGYHTAFLTPLSMKHLAGLNRACPVISATRQITLLLTTDPLIYDG